MKTSVGEFVKVLIEALVIVLLVSFFPRCAHRPGGGAVDSAGAGHDLRRHELPRHRPAQDFLGALVLALGLMVDDAIIGGDDGHQDGAGL